MRSPASNDVEQFASGGVSLGHSARSVIVSFDPKHHRTLFSSSTSPCRRLTRTRSENRPSRPSTQPSTMNVLRRLLRPRSRLRPRPVERRPRRPGRPPRAILPSEEVSESSSELVRDQETSTNPGSACESLSFSAGRGEVGQGGLIAEDRSSEIADRTTLFLLPLPLSSLQERESSTSAGAS